MLNQPDSIHDLNINQAAKQLAATPKIVRQAISNGLLKAYRVSPRNTRITQDALNEFKDNGGAL